MATNNKDAFDFLEDRRLKGVAVTGSELRGRYTPDQVKAGLTKQRKKISPQLDNSSGNNDVMDSQSKMRKLFSKGYK